MNYFEFKKLAYFMQANLGYYISHDYLLSIYTNIINNKINFTTYSDNLILKGVDVVSRENYLSVKNTGSTLSGITEFTSNPKELGLYNRENNISTYLNFDTKDEEISVNPNSFSSVQKAFANIRSRFYRRTYDVKNFNIQNHILFDFENRFFNSVFRDLSIGVNVDNDVTIVNTLLESIINSQCDITVLVDNLLTIRNNILRNHYIKLKAQTEIDVNCVIDMIAQAKFSHYESYNFSHLQNQKIKNIIFI